MILLTIFFTLEIENGLEIVILALCNVQTIPNATKSFKLITLSLNFEFIYEAKITLPSKIQFSNLLLTDQPDNSMR